MSNGCRHLPKTSRLLLAASDSELVSTYTTLIDVELLLTFKNFFFILLSDTIFAMADTTNAIPYGRRLLPSYLDEIAKRNPGRVYAAIPKTAAVEDGYIDVTIADLARCANFMAQWIEEKFGKSQNFETIAYVGLSDLRGVALFFAAVKTGYKVRYLLFQDDSRL